MSKRRARFRPPHPRLVAIRRDALHAAQGLELELPRPLAEPAGYAPAAALRSPQQRAQERAEFERWCGRVEIAVADRVLRNAERLAFWVRSGVTVERLRQAVAALEAGESEEHLPREHRSALSALADDPDVAGARNLVKAARGKADAALRDADAARGTDREQVTRARYELAVEAARRGDAEMIAVRDALLRRLLGDGQPPSRDHRPPAGAAGVAAVTGTA
jgi:hypothetical protein